MKEITMEVLGEFYGKCGKKAPFRDSNGEELYTGDVVKVRDYRGIGFGISSIVERYGEVFVMGIYGSYPESRKGEEEWRIYKVKSYKDIKPGEEIEDVIYKIKEIRKELFEKLKEEKITASEWKDRIVNYINQRYEESILQWVIKAKEEYRKWKIQTIIQ